MPLFIIAGVFICLWATGFIAAKIGLQYTTPATLLGLRALLTIAVFTVIVWLLKTSKLTYRQKLHSIFVGILLHGVYVGGSFAAIGYGMPSGLASLLVGLQPLTTALILVKWQNQQLKFSQWLGLVLGIVGLWLVLQGKLDWATHTNKVAAFTFIGCSLIGITIGTLYQKHFCQNIDLLSGAKWQYVGTFAFFLPIAWIFEPMHIQWDLSFTLVITWVVLALSVSAVLMLLYLVKQGQSQKVVSMFYLVPPMTALQAWLIFDEQMDELALAGFAVSAIAVALVTLAPSLTLSKGRMSEAN